jgi:L-aspartate oxidase
MAPTRQDAGHALIVGAGLAGLFTALRLAPLPVTVLAARAPGGGASSVWAQGGIACALGADDAPALHAADTIAAGAGIVDPVIAKILTEEGPARIADLAALGVPFDRDAQGRYRLGREAAHGRRRIVHVGGDRAGAAIMKALVEAVKRTPSIRVVWGYRALSLARAGGRIAGVHAIPMDDAASLQPVLFAAPFTILATGGIGALYAVTTNPPEARGDGLAMAARAGALIADPEFVQFHPTAIATGSDPAPLATEALRGEGAILVNERGERFMSGHPDGELAPRDVVARAIHREQARGGKAFLDCRAAIGAAFPARFPTVYAACGTHGIDPVTGLIPVAPAAHFHMGGIAVDAHGRSSLDGLFACGEVASTGAHGANRLASNSLLEAIVFGARIAEAIKGMTVAEAIKSTAAPAPATPEPWIIAERRGQAGERGALRALMTNCLGLERSAAGLTHALKALGALDSGPLAEQGGLATVGTLIAAAALMRRESRGSHFRSDYPVSDARLAARTFITLAEARAIAAQTLTPRPAREAAP